MDRFWAPPLFIHEGNVEPDSCEPIQRHHDLCRPGDAQAGWVVPELQPSLRKVADFILRHPLRATLTIEEMAHETRTSPAAVNRLAKALNLGGYSPDEGRTGGDAATSGIARRQAAQ